MKILDVRTLRLKFEQKSWLLLLVDTDQGITGWGDVSDSSHDEVMAGIVDTVIKPALLGKNPLELQACEQVLTAWRYPYYHETWSFAIARSGLDQALSDITAKHFGLPLYQYYGGTGKTEIPLYANLNNAIQRRRTPEDLQRQGELAKKGGFTFIKCTPFDEVNPSKMEVSCQRGFERLEALTSVWDISRIAVDCHQRFTRQSLGVMVETMLNTYGLPYWIEDPVPVLDYKTVQQMNILYPQIQWAAGEDALNATDLMRTVAADCYDVIMPDVRYIGGPTVLRGLHGGVTGMGKKMALHNPAGIIATAHSAHLCAVWDGLPLEFPLSAIENRELLSTPNECIVNGCYQFNDLPGLGLEISKEAIQDFGYTYQNGEWKKC